MTGALDKVFKTLPSSLISKFGKAITLTRITQGVYDPATSTATNTTADSTINAVVEEFKPFDFTSGLIVAGDKKITVASNGFTPPNLGDVLTIDGVKFTIVNLNTNYSGEFAALYVLQARRV